MRREKQWIVFALAAAGASFQIANIARADEVLIREVESLRNSLTARDAQRSTLTLRLADLYFYQSLELGRNPAPSASDEAKTAAFRKKAVSLYQEVRPPSGTLRYKIQFQLARLHSDLGQVAQATPIWKELVEQRDMPELRREAALRLAELAEQEGTAKSADEADRFYRLAIELCGGGDSCSYGHYRLAWLLRNAQKLGPALSEMRLALYDSKKQVREEALRDLVGFLTNVTGDGTQALNEVEDLSNRLSRPALLQDLASGYFSAGNKGAGTQVLDYVNQKTPTLAHQIRLMEEYYGLRDWTKFREKLEQAQASAEKTDASTLEAESEKTLKRLTVQLDGERISQKHLVADFQSAVLLYIKLYPQSPSRIKMFEGWVASEANDSRKVEQLGAWLSDSRFNLASADALKLREMRASYAQKAKDHATVASEMEGLAVIYKAKGQADRARESSYHRARALYELKNHEAALPIFRELALPASFPSKGADTWAIQSQNLALDILGQKKQYSELIAQASSWLKSPRITQEPTLADELRDMRAIAEQAQFEEAAAGGETPAALAAFQGFCLAGKFVPKSCDNAKVLAVKLKDQDSIITILKAKNLREELAGEYEAAGYFELAARSLEELSSPESLKIALLYELAGKNADRDRVLRKMISSPAIKASMGDREPIILMTLRDAGLIEASLLKMASWGMASRLSIADELEMKGKGTPETRKLILSSREYAGKSWSKMVLEETRSLDSQQRGFKFHGKQGQKKFELRLSALKRLAAYSDGYLNGADLATRTGMLEILVKAHGDLAQEILASPIPEQIQSNPEALAELQEALQKLAAPFLEKTSGYEALLKEQVAKASASDQIASTQSSRQVAMASDVEAYRRSIQALHRNPSDAGALAALQNHHELRGEKRLALYYQGRAIQAQKETNP